MSGARNYAIVTASYWGFTLTDDVNLFDIDEVRLNAAIEEIKEELELMCEEEFIEPHVIEEALQRIKTFTDLKKSVADRDYVIEAVPEDLELKQRLFQELDGYCPRHAYSYSCS